MLIPFYKNVIFRNSIAMLLFLFATYSLKGQNISPDQIKRQLRELRLAPEFNKRDTTHIILLNDLNFAIRFQNLDTALILGKEALELSKIIAYKKGEANSFINIANFYLFTGSPNTAIQYANDALEISSKHNYFEQDARAFNVLGKAYFQMTDYPNSYKYFLKGSESAKKISSKHYDILLNMNIGTMYSLLHDYQEALNYYDEALSAAMVYNEELLKWKIKTNIAYLQSNMSNFDEAFININESITYFNNTHQKQWLAFATTTKAGIFLKQNKFENAHIYYHKAKVIHSALQDGKGKADVTYGLAASYLGIGELEYAEKLAKQSLEMYREMQVKTGIQKSYTTLYKINEAKNKPVEALQFLKLARELSDTIAVELNKTNLKMLRTKLDFQKEKELLHDQTDARINEQRAINHLVLIALVASLLFGFIISWANKRAKRLNNELNEKGAVLASRELQLREINSAQKTLFSIVGHDLKGPIGSLRELLKVMSNENEKEVLLKNLLPKLNNYTNHVYFTLDNLLNWGKTQMKGENISPVKLNIQAIASEVISLYSEAILKKELSVKVDIDKEISAWVDKEDINVVLRNLLSNAIKFTPSKGRIKLTVKSTDDQIILVVEDNGVGMSAEAQKLVYDLNAHYSTFGTNNEKGTGLGLMLCKEIIARNKGEISVESSEKKGTKFTVCLPKGK